MEIPTTVASASAYTQGQFATRVGAAVAVKVQDAQRQEGADALKLLAAAVPGAGGNGLGGSVDVSA